MQYNVLLFLLFLNVCNDCGMAENAVNSFTFFSPPTMHVLLMSLNNLQLEIQLPQIL